MARQSPGLQTPGGHGEVVERCHTRHADDDRKQRPLKAVFQTNLRSSRSCPPVLIFFQTLKTTNIKQNSKKTRAFSVEVTKRGGQRTHHHKTLDGFCVTTPKKAWARISPPQGPVGFERRPTPLAQPVEGGSGRRGPWWGCEADTVVKRIVPDLIREEFGNSYQWNSRSKRNCTVNGLNHEPGQKSAHPTPEPPVGFCIPTRPN